MSGSGGKGSAPATVGPAVNPRLDRRGLLATGLSFLSWGLLPLYLKLLASVPVFQVMGHRVIWACVFVFAWLGLRGQLGAAGRVFRQPQALSKLLLTAGLISVNWAVYVWAVADGHVVDASLGYFINPLVSVMLGVFLLSEKLNRWQWVAVSVAAVGVIWLTVQLGHPPWAALALAISFGLYGFVRKTVAGVDSVAALAIETVLILPFALAWIGFEAWRGQGAFGHQGPVMDVLLVLSGLVTAVPLVLFAYGVRRIPLSTVGLMQYAAPTLQLITAVLLFGEPFTHVQLIGFACIWAALVIYAIDGFVRGRAPKPAASVQAAEAA
ncbi:EamA family transporter RarD [Hydrocarboniphaga effusa]|uniref:EamA family transporter RarD n=2 Tax=Hydrocarboniphaga effusa TaxID=243629 RepID=UPI00398C0812